MKQHTDYIRRQLAFALRHSRGGKAQVSDAIQRAIDGLDHLEADPAWPTEFTEFKDTTATRPFTDKDAGELLLLALPEEDRERVRQEAKQKTEFVSRKELADVFRSIGQTAIDIDISHAARPTYASMGEAFLLAGEKIDPEMVNDLSSSPPEGYSGEGLADRPLKMMETIRKALSSGADRPSPQNALTPTEMLTVRLTAKDPLDLDIPSLEEIEQAMDAEENAEKT